MVKVSGVVELKVAGTQKDIDGESLAREGSVCGHKYRQLNFDHIIWDAAMFIISGTCHKFRVQQNCSYKWSLNEWS